MLLLPAWQPAPEQLLLEPGQAHIFRLPLELPPELLQTLSGLLSADEQARAARYHFERDQRRFTAARGQLRQVLAAYLHVVPRAVQFTYNPYGKPALAEANHTGQPDVQFNLSHSGELGLLAVCKGQPVGIDIEIIRDNLERGNIARRYFAPSEVMALEALPPDQQLQAFFACWTRKEAYIKARGQGLSIGLDTFAVSLAPGEAAQLLVRDPGAPGGPFTLLTLDPEPGYAAALAVEGEIDGVKLWDHFK
jgi:4'-phosphopantetheinyl transferase